MIGGRETPRTAGSVRRVPRRPFRRRAARTAAVAAVLCLAAWPAAAGKVVLRIRAGNPVDTPQSVPVKATLPVRIGTNDILSLGGLDLGYDVKNDLYYVHKNVSLGAKEIAVFDVELRDVWRFESAELAALRNRARELAPLLDGTDYAASAAGLLGAVEAAVAAVETNQAANAIEAGVPPVQHIRAYEADLKRVERARRDIGRMENLALAAGRDPGKLIGAAQDTPPRRELPLDPAELKTASIRYTLRNTSPNERREIRFRRELPAEIRPDDVLDAGGLEVRVDGRGGGVFVSKDKVEIGPGETVVFDVKVRDRWNVNRPRIAALLRRADDVLEQTGGRKQFESMGATLDGLRSELAAIERERGPETLDGRYVEFYRGQAGRLDGLEGKLHRIEEALRPADPKQQLGFDLRPPSTKTTWLIIYVILGFLALFSLLFFLRWMARAKADTMRE